MISIRREPVSYTKRREQVSRVGSNRVINMETLLVVRAICFAVAAKLLQLDARRDLIEAAQERFLLPILLRLRRCDAASTV